MILFSLFLIGQATIKCKCGCGRKFKKNRPWQNFVNEDHRKKYWRIKMAEAYKVVLSRSTGEGI